MIFLFTHMVMGALLNLNDISPPPDKLSLRTERWTKEKFENPRDMQSIYSKIASSIFHQDVEDSSNFFETTISAVKEKFRLYNGSNVSKTRIKIYFSDDSMNLQSVSIPMTNFFVAGNRIRDGHDIGVSGIKFAQEYLNELNNSYDQQLIGSIGMSGFFESVYGISLRFGKKAETDLMILYSLHQEKVINELFDIFDGYIKNNFGGRCVIRGILIDTVTCLPPCAWCSEVLDYEIQQNILGKYIKNKFALYIQSDNLFYFGFNFTSVNSKKYLSCYGISIIMN